VLAEIKAALDNDPRKFADACAKPILVERLLREKFDNDDALHAPQRREMEQMREQLLAVLSSRGNEALTSPSQLSTLNSQRDSSSLLTSATTDDLVKKLIAILRQSHSNEVTETTWQLGARPAETNAPAADELEIKKRFGPNARILSAPHAADGKAQQF